MWNPGTFYERNGNENGQSNSITPLWVGPTVPNFSDLLVTNIHTCTCTYIHSYIHTFTLLVLAVLESGAPLSSSLEEALYKCSV